MSSKIRIGVCDDDSMILRVIAEAVKDILSKKECVGEIEKFSSAEELWRTMEREKYSLLFLDIDMPDMNGITLAEKIRARYNEETITTGHQIRFSLEIFTFHSIQVTVIEKDAPGNQYSATFAVAICDGGTGKTEVRVIGNDGKIASFRIACQVNRIS